MSVFQTPIFTGCQFRPPFLQCVNLIRRIRISNGDVEEESFGRVIPIRIRNRREQIRHRNIPKQSRPNHLRSRQSHHIFDRFRSKPTKEIFFNYFKLVFSLE
jgi:hypothetical protein